MSYCDYQISLEDQKQRVIDYIKSKKNEFVDKGLDSIYIKGEECDFGRYIEITISVIYINKFIDDYEYWVDIREKTRRNGSTYVSNDLIDDVDYDYLEIFELIEI